MLGSVPNILQPTVLHWCAESLEGAENTQGGLPL